MVRRKTINVSGFPHRVPAEQVKSFLERFTGLGSIVALEVKQSKRGPRAYARVQFISRECAEKIMVLTQTRLYYGTSYLKAWEADNDMVRNPRVYLHEMESVKLYFGCQVSTDKFSVLWDKNDVSVKFGISLKKMYFLFSVGSVDYKLQLSYQNIWQIVLHRSTLQTGKYLVLQLFGAPRIYQKAATHVYSYYHETQDDQWFRTTDFPTSCIGQSSGLCIQLPHSMTSPNFEDNFVYYKESTTPFFLGMGRSFSRNLALVPIVHPPPGHQLPYRILFKVCSLVQTGCIPGPKLDPGFYQLVNPDKYDTTHIEHALEKLYYLKECCYDPVNWLVEQYKKYHLLKEIPKLPAISLDDGLVYIHRVQVTPTRIYFCGPEVNMSNRVLRNYRNHIDNFLRVSFVDEEWDKMYSTDLSRE